MVPDSLADDPAVAGVAAWNAAAIKDANLARDEVTLTIAAELIRETCRYLKDEQGFVRLSNVTAVDRYPAEPRFEIVYHVHSIVNNQRLRLKCIVGGEEPAIESVTSVWRSADWYEREVYDLFGVRFEGHPNLKRLLMPEDWEGHPLRKDFPVHGYKYGYQDE